jgi:hypothetical protein
MTQVDVVLLMMFSNFYKQRMLPSEIYQFFVNNKTDNEDLDIETNIDYLKIEDDMQKLKVPRVKFAEKIEVDEDEIDPGTMPHPPINPIIQMHHDYIKAYMM